MRVVFEINGNRRVAKVKDEDIKDSVAVAVTRYADEENPMEIGANIPGAVIKILIKEGDKVEANQAIAVLEAMKMEIEVKAPKDGIIGSIEVSKGQSVANNQVVARFK